MRGRTIALIVLMGVVIVGASASAWLPSVSRRLSLSRRPTKQETELANKQHESQELQPGSLKSPQSEQPACINGTLIRNVCYPPGTTQGDVQQADELCKNLQACEFSLVSQMQFHNVDDDVIKAAQRRVAQLQQQNATLESTAQSNAQAHAESVLRAGDLVDEKDREIQDLQGRVSQLQTLLDRANDGLIKAKQIMDRQDELANQMANRQDKIFAEAYEVGKIDGRAEERRTGCR